MIHQRLEQSEEMIPTPKKVRSSVCTRSAAKNSKPPLLNVHRCPREAGRLRIIPPVTPYVKRHESVPLCHQIEPPGVEWLTIDPLGSLHRNCSLFDRKKSATSKVG